MALYFCIFIFFYIFVISLCMVVHGCTFVAAAQATYSSALLAAGSAIEMTGLVVKDEVGSARHLSVGFLLAFQIFVHVFSTFNGASLS